MTDRCLQYIAVSEWFPMLKYEPRKERKNKAKLVGAVKKVKQLNLRVFHVYFAISSDSGCACVYHTWTWSSIRRCRWSLELSHWIEFFSHSNCVWFVIKANIFMYIWSGIEWIHSTAWAWDEGFISLCHDDGQSTFSISTEMLLIKVGFGLTKWALLDECEATIHWLFAPHNSNFW